MARPPGRTHIDLFNDPSWDSPDSGEEEAAYERLVVSGFSPRAESAVLVFFVSFWFLGLAAFVILCLVFSNAFSFSVLTASRLTERSPPLPWPRCACSWWCRASTPVPHSWSAPTVTNSSPARP